MSRAATAGVALAAVAVACCQRFAGNIWDDAAEVLSDFVLPQPQALQAVPGSNASGTVRWQEILPRRDFHCNFWESPEVCHVARGFKPRPGDILIVTFPKTGTTFMQQLTHQLRSGGDMGFRDINDVVPFVEVNPAYRGDAGDVVQPHSPRLFKVHQPLSVFDGGRRIVLMRDPFDTFKSLYNYLQERGMAFAHRNYVVWQLGQSMGLPGWPEVLVDRSPKTPKEYARSSMGWRRELMGGTNFYHYMAEFWLARHDPDVLLLCYEDLIGPHKRSWVQLLAKFMGVRQTPGLLDRVYSMTSKKFMAEHSRKFDDSGIAEAINRQGGAPIEDVPYNAASKVGLREGGLDGEEAVRRQLAAEWEAQLLPVTRHADYLALRRARVRELVARHPDILAGVTAVL